MMKLVSKLRGFKNYSDLKATLTNRRGNQVIDSISKTGNFNGRFAFRFERGELPGKLRHKRASLKITIESLNKKSEANFLKGDEEFSFAPQRQVQRFRLFKDKKNSSRRFFVQGRMINQDQDGPIFTSPNSIDSIIEGTTAGKEIFLAKANDVSAPITYSLTGRDAKSFNINANSGAVTITENTNHNLKPNYVFNVVATDSKGNPTTSKPLTLSINQDQPPVFTSPTTVTPVKEDSPKGTVIYSASATDDGGEVTYSLIGTDAASFKIDPKSGAVSTEVGLELRTKSRYSFDIVATDSGIKNQQTILPLTLDVAKAGATLTKIVGKNILPPETTRFSDTITAEVGTANDAIIQDTSLSDRDKIIIKTNQFNRLENIFSAGAPGTRFINIEDFEIQSTNDGSDADLNLQGITNGKTLAFKSPSTFSRATKYINWGTTGITDFNFNGINSAFGIELNNANSGLPTNQDSIKVAGTPGPDTLEGLSGDIHLLGGLGVDNLRGSTLGQSTIAGGAGQDIIHFPNPNKQNTIDLVRQKTTASRDTITGYTGANAATKLNNSFDLIQINDGSFPNYAAGATVEQTTIAEAGASPSLANTLIVGLEAEIERQVFPTGNQGLLAFSTDTSKLLFAPAGNFTANTQELLHLDSNIFSAPDQIVVIDADHF